MTTAVVAVPKARHIEVNGHHIHLRFVQQAAWVLILGLLSVAAMAAVYYLLFEQQYGAVWLKPGWDGLFKQDWWTTYRHGLRDVGEGFLAKFVVQAIMAKWQKHPELRLTGKQATVRVAWIMVLTLALILIGIWAVDYALPLAWHHAFHHYVVTGPKVGGAVTSVTSNGLFAGINWSDFIIGFVGAHILRYVWRPVGATINLAFVEPRVLAIRASRARRGDPAWLPRWMKQPLVPPTIRERVAWMLANDVSCEQHSPWMARFAIAGGVVFLALAGYGEYVLHVIAKG